MATIRERGPGVWEVRVFMGRGPDGQPRQASHTVRGGKREAQRLAAQLSGRRSPTSAGRTTVSELLDLWLEQQTPCWTPHTLANQRSRVRSIKADPIAKVALERLTAVDVDRWHARLRLAQIGDGALRNQHAVLRAAVTQAVRWGWLSTNVVAIARLGRQKQTPRGAMGADDVRRVLGSATNLVEVGEVEPAAAAALRLAAVTGARRSELAALRWEDLDGDRLTIDSSLTIIRHGSQSERRPPTLRADPTKTANRRTVTLDATTVRLLEDLRMRFDSYGPWIFSVGDRPVNPERVGAWWRRARDKAGVDKKWRLHDLRHWSATVSIASGHDIRTVANRLGHANPAMTLRVYTHAVEANDRGVADLMGAVLG